MSYHAFLSYRKVIDLRGSDSTGHIWYCGPHKNDDP